MRARKPISAPVQSAVSELLPELHAGSGCEQIGLTHEAFGEILADVAMKYLPPHATEREACAFRAVAETFPGFAFGVLLAAEQDGCGIVCVGAVC